MIFVDTNILIDLFAKDPIWMPRSSAAVRSASARDRLVLNDIIYAEFAPGFTLMHDLDAALAAMRIDIVTIPRPALFLAGHAFRQYRRQRGTQTSILADFLIGAHAAFEGASVLTRDPRWISGYFPTVKLITP